MSIPSQSQRAFRIASSAALALVAGAAVASSQPGAYPTPPGFSSIFSGRDLAGWHVSRTSSHGATPDFHVENGILIGAQRPPGKGGLLVSDRRYGNVEISLEVRRTSAATAASSSAPTKTGEPTR